VPYVWETVYWTGVVRGEAASIESKHEGQQVPSVRIGINILGPRTLGYRSALASKILVIAKAARCPAKWSKASLLTYALHARILPGGPSYGLGDRRGNVLVLLYQGEIALGIFEVRLFRGAVDAPTMRARAGDVPSSRRPSYFLRAALFYRSPGNTPRTPILGQGSSKFSPN
jgi:hypothetical protein